MSIVTKNAQFFIEKFSKDKSYKGLKKFSCGNVAIDKYARENFKKDGLRDNKMVFALVEDVPVSTASTKEENSSVETHLRGLVTMQNFSLTAQSGSHYGLLKGSEHFTYSLPPVISTVKIFMLGVDKNYQKKPEQWGRQLMLMALEKCMEIAEVSSDVKGVILDASQDAVGFYKKLRFIALQDEPDENGTVPMFLPIHQLMDANKRASKQVQTTSAALSDSSAD